jgi:hypothetical protein
MEWGYIFTLMVNAVFFMEHILFKLLAYAEKCIGWRNLQQITRATIVFKFTT